MFRSHTLNILFLIILSSRLFSQELEIKHIVNSNFARLKILQQLRGDRITRPGIKTAEKNIQIFPKDKKLPNEILEKILRDAQLTIIGGMQDSVELFSRSITLGSENICNFVQWERDWLLTRYVKNRKIEHKDYEFEGRLFYWNLCTGNQFSPTTAIWGRKWYPRSSIDDQDPVFLSPNNKYRVKIIKDILLDSNEIANSLTKETVTVINADTKGIVHNDAAVNYFSWPGDLSRECKSLFTWSLDSAKFLAATNNNKAVIMYRIHDKKNSLLEELYRLPIGSKIEDITFAPHGEVFALQAQDEMLEYVVKIFDSQAGECRTTLPCTVHSTSGGMKLNALASLWNSSGTMLALFDQHDNEHCVNVYEITSKEHLLKYLQREITENKPTAKEYFLILLLLKYNFSPEQLRQIQEELPFGIAEGLEILLPHEEIPKKEESPERVSFDTNQPKPMVKKAEPQKSSLLSFLGNLFTSESVQSKANKDKKSCCI